ncbi:hypothetical protein B0A50_04975 [Salinomyces thailandicus]|uniref:GPI transamidase component GPI16 n=1 Tax=Salinomyces thailandicus TaxID=706561 RepID=A0A4U0TXZ6_9PEZI|nr:hypothetical protein B0A50_04975 [Salinomyces thailandica]
MKLQPLFALPATLLPVVFAAADPHAAYTEHLDLHPLPDGHLYAGFNFTATTSHAAYEAQHFRYFPRSLAQILQHTRTAELHLRFAFGRWDDESWGARPRGGRREGGTGAELWAWVDGEEDHPEVLEERWGGLVNSLSGLFCASLNFIDGTRTTRPVLSFEPEGTHKHGNEAQLLHGTLPHEVVCTENLTPFLKLLPCQGKAGISSLLDGHKVFDANWQTMAIDVRPLCNAKGEDCALEIQQTVDMVLDVERSMRPSHDPIPRPLPIEQIECDTSKEYHSDDTCYPQAPSGAPGWSLRKVFGQPINGNCDLESADATPNYPITLHVPADHPVELLSSASLPGKEEKMNLGSTIIHYPLPPHPHTFDISLPPHPQPPEPRNPPLLHATRHLTGHGLDPPILTTTLSNPSLSKNLTLTYLDTLPWFLRPYIHTLRLQRLSRACGDSAELQQLFYTPARDRERGSKIELLLHLPAGCTAQLSYGVEKAVLRYAEYPPDANRGFDVAGGIIKILPDSLLDEQVNNDSKREAASYLRTPPLLLPLPTPDFSMPYNVIILTSTVLALGFGSVFNLVVRRFVLVEEVPAAGLPTRLRDAVRALKLRLSSLGGRSGVEGKAGRVAGGTTVAG